MGSLTTSEAAGSVFGQVALHRGHVASFFFSVRRRVGAALGVHRKYVPWFHLRLHVPLICSPGGGSQRYRTQEGCPRRNWAI